MKFLHQLIETALSSLSPQDLGRSLFLFPSKRAILFFRQELKNWVNRPDLLLIPELMTLSDWVIRCGGFQTASRETLLLHLFRSYRTAAGEKALPFEQFYPHASAMLVDLTETDRALLNEEEIREMAAMAQSSDNQSSACSTLLNFFPRLHEAFRRSLRESGQVHDALAMRSLLEQPMAVETQLQDYPAVYACGFYPINRAEIELFRRMNRLPQVRFFWDGDRYFVDSPEQEAGWFFSQAPDLVVPDSIGENDLLEGERTITLVETQGDVDQAKATTTILRELSSGSATQAVETALILPDESLLLPLLSAIPGEYEKINITMGYPLSQTLPVSFLHRLQDLHRQMEENGGTVPFKPLHELLVHPAYSSFLGTEAREKLLQFLKKQVRSVSRDEAADLLGPLKSILSPPATPGELFTMILELLDRLKSEPRDDDPRKQSAPRTELLYQVRRQTLAAARFASSPEIQLSRESAWLLLWEFIDAGFIPFSGEPLEGLQIMGMLETRCLDFQNLIILSFNEGSYPQRRLGFSLIPPEVRKRFGLTGQREQDSRAAYHFYRLLKRCRRCWLIYNGSGRIERSNEASRFVKQIEHELSLLNPKNLLKVQPFTHIPPKLSSSDLFVPNHEDLRRKWREMSFSASAVNSFLRCPMMFFYRYGLKLEERNRAVEEMDPRGIGLIAHACLEKLFRPYLGKKVDRSATRSMTARLEEVLTQASREAYPGLNSDRGRPYLERKILSRLLEQILQSQMELPPFRLEGVEKKLFGPFVLPDGSVFHLQGQMDRIDRTEEGWRIVDYKSGGLGSSDLSTQKMPSEFTPESPYNQKNLVWQLLFYQQLFCLKGESPPETVRCALFSLRNPAEGFQEVQGDPGELHLKFKKLLQGFFTGLADPETLFSRTSDESKCRSCPYSDLCLR